MAPAIPIEFTGQRKSKKFSKRGTGDMMGKTRKVSKGSSASFVPDYRHAVETVAESEGFVCSGRADVELTASEDPCAPNRKCVSLNTDGFDRSIVPTHHISLSMMSAFERRDLQTRLKSELDKVLKLQRELAAFSSSGTACPPDIVVDAYQYGLERHATAETLPLSSGKKKNPPGRNGPHSKGGPMAANNRTEFVKRGLPKNTSFAMLMKQCDALLTRLMGHQQGWIFNEPVDIVKHNIPDYFNVIKHPMDLGTVKHKLISNQYSNPIDFAADVRLTFRNAMTYNPVGHTVHNMADAMSKFFETRWKPIENKISSRADESVVTKLNNVMETESAYLHPAKKQKTTFRENNVRHENDKQVMSDDERQKLGTDLEEYLTELPDNIVSFLKESTSNSSQVNEDEIEIELDTLSDEILFKLRKLLDDFVMERQKKESNPKTCEIEMQNETGFDSLLNQHHKENGPVDEDVDIGINGAPPASSSPLIETDVHAARRNNKYNSSKSSGSESGSSSPDTESGSFACRRNADKKSITANGTADAVVKQKQRELREDPNLGAILIGNNHRSAASNSSSYIEPPCRPEGESGPPERQVSPDKLYRAALLRSRFADIILKAQEIEKGERHDPENLKLDKEEVERWRKEEKARLQAEAKAAEVARKRAEMEAAAEIKRRREVEREAARQALLKMEKTVEINESSQVMEDLENLRSAQDETLESFFIEAASPENSQNALGSFKFQASSNPLEQLGLYMKNDEDEEETEPRSNVDT